MKIESIIKSVLTTIILGSMMMSATAIFSYTKFWAYLNVFVAGLFIYILALKYFEVKEKKK